MADQPSAEPGPLDRHLTGLVSGGLLFMFGVATLVYAPTVLGVVLTLVGCLTVSVAVKNIARSSRDQSGDP